MAVGAPYNVDNGSNSGHVRVYNFVEGDWTQKGNDIDGKNGGDLSGFSVSLSGDGTTVAIGTQIGSNVRIYNYPNPLTNPPSYPPTNPPSKIEQIGNATISEASCKDNNFSSCYKVVHSIGQQTKDVSVDLMGERCKDNLPQGEATGINPFPFEGDEFSYNVTVDLSKLSLLNRTESSKEHLQRYMAECDQL